MPAVKKSDYETWNNQFSALIEKGMKMQDKDDTDMAKLLGISMPTWYKRKKEPALFSTYELYVMRRALKLTSMDIMDIYRCEYKLQLA